MDLTGAQYYSGTLGEYWAPLYIGPYWALLGPYWALLGEYWAPLGELGLGNSGRGFLNVH